MTSSISAFRDRYAAMSDGQLITVATRHAGSLVEEARLALDAEIKRRRLDMDTHQKLVQKDIQALDQRREQRIAKERSDYRWKSWVVYGISLLLAAYGAYLEWNRVPYREQEDGGILILVALCLALFAAVVGRIRIWLRVKFLHGKWWN